MQKQGLGEKTQGADASRCGPGVLTSVRARIRELLVRGARRERGDDVVVLAVDGMSYALARSCWGHARLERLTSVFPTTSTAAWLSSLTGLPVSEHGVPGVVLRGPDGSGLINALQYAGPGFASFANLFDDASALGYAPIALAGDLSYVPSAWRDSLLHRANTFMRPLLRLTERTLSPARVADEILSAIVSTLDDQGTGRRLVWCFVDLDAYVHHHGYDTYALEVVRELQRVALILARRAIVLAYSDHGLTATEHDPALAERLARLCEIHGAVMGGAGRTRWLYAGDATDVAVLLDACERLSSEVLVTRAETLFPAASLARSRVGEVVLMADGARFLTTPGYAFDHGSWTAEEVFVPFALW